MGSEDRGSKNSKESDRFHSIGREMYLFLLNRWQEEEIDTVTEVDLDAVHEYNIIFIKYHVPCIVLSTLHLLSHLILTTLPCGVNIITPLSLYS